MKKARARKKSIHSIQMTGGGEHPQRRMRYEEYVIRRIRRIMCDTASQHHMTPGTEIAVYTLYTPLLPVYAHLYAHVIHEYTPSKHL